NAERSTRTPVSGWAGTLGCAGALWANAVAAPVSDGYGPSSSAEAARRRRRHVRAWLIALPSVPLPRRLPHPGPQVALGEGSDLAVEHGAGVARLHVGAVVLDQVVRVQHVGANLITPAGLLVLALELGLLGLALVGLDLSQAREQDLHRRFAVLKLRALVLA